MSEKWFLNGKEFEEILKKIFVITNSTLVNLVIKDNNINLKSGFNQHFVSYNFPIEYKGNEIKFGIKSDILRSFLTGKEKVDFELEDSVLKFKSGRSRGNIQVLPWEDFEIELNDTKPISKNIINFLFNNLNKVKLIGNGFSNNSTLRIRIKDKLAKMMVAEDSYIALASEHLETNEEANFDISLFYANLLVDSFNKEDNLEININSNIVGIKSDNCIIILPRIVDSNEFTIELEEEDFNNTIIKENLVGQFLINNKNELLNSLKEIKSFYTTAGNRGFFKILSKNNKIYLSVKNQESSMCKEIENVKISGNLEFSTEINSFLFVLENIDDGIIKIADYKSKILIKSNSSPESRYQLWKVIE